MKNSLRTLLFRIAAAVGGLLIISVGLLLLVMRPIPDGRVAEGIWAIKDISVNLFIIRGTRGFIATDADMNPDEVTQSLRKLSIVPSDVHTVLLTHTDSDHSGGISAFPIADEPYQLVDPGITLNIDGRIIQVVSTPEHSPGSTTYIGDSGLHSRGTIAPLPRLLNNSHEMAERTITDPLNRYENLEYIFTAHDGVWSADRN
jgi:glyoxylase-like metal-dependent hydrolase (beta-lactamase superfamily II)